MTKHKTESPMKFIEAILLIMLLWMSESCDKVDEVELGNPLDPESPEYIEPGVTITEGPSEDENVNSTEVTFRWEGNFPSLSHPMEYSYSFQPVLDDAEWSGWTTSNSFTFRNLDEGSYRLSVKSKYPGGIKESSRYAMRSFTIDAVKGPALMTKPRYTVVNQGSDFRVDLIAEEVSDLMLAHVVLTYQTSMLQIEDVEQGYFLASNGGTIIFFKDTSEAGRIEINTGVGAGSPAGVDGSGAISQLTFKALGKGETRLTFQQTSELRDPNNGSISIKERVSGVVLIQVGR